MRHFPKALFGLLFLAGCETAELQEPGEPQAVSIPVALDVGQVYEMTVTTERQRSNGGIDRYRTTEQIAVTERFGDGYVLADTAGRWDFTSVEEPAGSMMESLAEGFAGRTYEIETDQYGAPARIREWRPLVQEAFGKARVMAAGIGDRRLAGMNPETRAAATEQVGRMIDRIATQYAQMDDRDAALVVGENLWLWAFPAGLEISTDQPLSGAVQIPSPLGGPPLSGIELVELVSVRNGVATIRREQRLDDAGTQALMERVIGIMDIPEAQMTQALTQIRTMEMAVVVQQAFETEVETGLTRRVTQEKRVSVGPAGRSREETVLEIERLQ